MGCFFVEDLCIEPVKCICVCLILELLVPSEEHADGEHQIDAHFVVLVVLILVRDAIYAFELISAPRGFDYFVGDALAGFLCLCQVSYGA